ncbi:TetR/AcrR family transcriptional regulator [Reichenbachiella versicolor]|uniref:TetR/AcrR family transcriptional regulator n=1 Tax=Reichenbachiella versicolor TaxID=1821036 RepID=UPI000D6E8D0F|nr:TetR/AcrR family transcriptional regulator [Reichenbachiella versicolor]
MPQTNDNRNKWLQTGYELFGEIGPLALNVEKLSNLVGLNRSSFYHYFGDMDMYETRLLEHHVARFEVFGDLMKNYSNFEQLFGSEIMQHQDALAFHRQLLVNQSTARYKECSDKARVFTEQKTYELWNDYSKPQGEEKEKWEIFRALRDFYYIHFGQKVLDGETNPQEVLIKLQSYFTSNPS